VAEIYKPEVEKSAPVGIGLNKIVKFDGLN